MGCGYFGILEMRRVWHDVMYAPDGKRGFYCKASQKKRRKMRRRVGKRGGK